MNTLNDFWRMIWEYNVGVIVMVTKCREELKVWWHLHNDYACSDRRRACGCCSVASCSLHVTWQIDNDSFYRPGTVEQNTSVKRQTNVCLCVCLDEMRAVLAWDVSDAVWWHHLDSSVYTTSTWPRTENTQRHQSTTINTHVTTTAAIDCLHWYDCCHEFTNHNNIYLLSDDALLQAVLTTTTLLMQCWLHCLIMSVVQQRREVTELTADRQTDR